MTIAFNSIKFVGIVIFAMLLSPLGAVVYVLAAVTYLPLSLVGLATLALAYVYYRIGKERAEPHYLRTSEPDYLLGASALFVAGCALLIGALSEVV